MIATSCQNPFQPFQPKIRTEHFLHFLQQLQQVCFACMWQFKMFSRNNLFPHFCRFPNISFTAGDTGCVFLQSRVVRAHVCTIFSSTDRIKRLRTLCSLKNCTGCLHAVVQLGLKLATAKSEVFPPEEEGGTKSSIWRIVNKCQKYILCRQA